MLFSELNFWLFFLVTFSLYCFANHKQQNRLLLIASYAFYCAWDWRFLSLILISTVVDFYVGKQIFSAGTAAAKKRWLVLSLVVNLGLLGVFKYFNFFVDSFQALADHLGFPVDPLIVSIVLPVGISFYTFQTLSYSIDIYRGKLLPEKDPLNFALFVAFFPQLVAGPIERARNLLPNISSPRIITEENLSRGAVLCLIGLLKKIVIADGIAPSVDSVYSAADPSWAAIILATWLFAIQIYCDFSGYTDIARGVSKMLGFELMRNFSQPYFATNPQEFWRRWHISLSTWLRDYLYISLGGNRGGAGKTYRNLMITMGLGGLWHGAAWNFVLWGLYQGALLSIHRYFQSLNRFRFDFEFNARTLLAKPILIFTFFQITCYGWLLFRADSLDQILRFTHALAHFSDGSSMKSIPFAPSVGILFLFVWDLVIHVKGNETSYLALPNWSRIILWAGLVYFLFFGANTQSNAFIYFQF